MTRNSFAIRLAGAAAFVVCAAGSAAAQQPDAGPYGNLFKGSGTPQTHSLDISGGLFGGYDDTPLAQAPNLGDAAIFDPRLRAPGPTSGFSSAAMYHYGHTGRGRLPASVSFGAQASLQEFQGGTSKALWSPNYGVNTSFGKNLTPKVVFSASASLAYAPYYQYAPFLSIAAGGGSTINTPVVDGTATDTGGSPEASAATLNQPPTNFNPLGTDGGYAVDSQNVTQLSTRASIADRFTKRTSVSLAGGWDAMAFTGSRVETETAILQLSHNLTRKLGVHVGYILQDARFIQESSPSSRSQNHSIDFGVDYGDGGSITFARYYTFSFATGLSALRHGSDTLFRLDGSATLVRRLGRTWAASIGAARGTSYVLGFSDPIFSDSAVAGFGGQIVPRLNFSASANYLQGKNAFSSSGAALVSKGASARLTFGVSRHLGIYGQYSYYRYDVPDGFFTTIAFPQHQNRRSASVGLSFWAPLINQRTPRQP